MQTLHYRWTYKPCYFLAAGQDYVPLDYRTTVDTLEPFTVPLTILDDTIMDPFELFSVELNTSYTGLDNRRITTRSVLAINIFGINKYSFHQFSNYSLASVR